MSPILLFLEETNFLFPTLFLILLPLLFFTIKHLKTSSLPPGPFPWPILGNLLQLGKDPLHIALKRFSQTHGPLFRLKLGTQLVVVGSSPAAAIEILKTNDRNLSARYVPEAIPFKSSELNNFSIGWVLECNESWKHSRMLCRSELFSAKALGSQASIREKKAMEMLRLVGKREGEMVKIREFAFATIFNMMSDILVSKDLLDFEMESINGGMSGLLRNLAELGSTPNVSDLFPVLSQLDLQSLRKRSREVFERISKIWEAIIKERKDRKILEDVLGKNDFLDVLIENDFPDNQINILLMELLSAGTDSSSITIEWTMTELIKNPKYMKKVQEELTREIKQDQLVKESDLPKLTYLEACVKESLRLHPPAPIPIPRRASETCQVMNYTIPKNTQVLVNIWEIGRDPNYWEDPLEFKPERFLDSSLDFKGNNYEFLPFSSGRRMCPGISMAAKQVPLVLASLIHSFDWSLPQGMEANELDMSETYDIALLKKQPLLLIPRAKML
ncbi:hypothetical protein UlMin_004270 [Ulmus minor]